MITIQTNSPQHENARHYYGKALESSDDLKTSACCIDTIPPYQKRLLANISDEILDRFYGCGSPLPHGIEGLTVLDLGCGTGRDVYLASQLVGEHGKVIGIDMTEEQLAIARRHQIEQAGCFGHPAPNTIFRQATIEDLSVAGIEDHSIDLVISNCVINLSPAKKAVFREIFRVLKEGGELYFADVFVDRRLPADLSGNSVLHGECLGGALYEEDFRRLLLSQGCPDYRICEARELEIKDEAIRMELGKARFFSRTIRAFKLDGLEDRCEDYGQAVRYRGSIQECPDEFILDNYHAFQTGKIYEVCGNTADMLSKTRFKAHFDLIGDRSRHFGLFDCGDKSSDKSDPGTSGTCC